jgi:hypothetical protein
MDNEQKEELRRLCLRWLADRSALAFNARSVHEGTKRDISATLPETEEALFFLQSSGLIVNVPNEMGGTKYYQVNAAGILRRESGS